MKTSACLVLLVALVGAGCVPRTAVEPVTAAPSPIVTVPEAAYPASSVQADRQSGAANRSNASPPAQTVAVPVAAVSVDTATPANRAAADSTAPAIARESAQMFPMLALDQYASQERVDYYIKVFTGRARAEMTSWLSAGTRYSTMIREKLRAGGIPEDFLYLALIESGYDPHSYSTAAAVGMWQFMSSTARDEGLRVDWWIDERRDAVKETDAAIKLLNELKTQFGSLYLAAAAYDGGSGRVSRGLTKMARQVEGSEPEDKFFVLASSNVLRTETKNYVPQLIAAALVARAPLQYGIAVDTLAPFVFDSVAVPANTGVSAIAGACHADVPKILDYNGQILRGMTPPSGDAVWVRVPVGCAAGFADALSSLDSSARRGSFTHVAKKTETPASVAKKEGISLATLRRYNPKLKTPAAELLSPGLKLVIPSSATIKTARDVPDPAIERYGTGAAEGGQYVVKAGDTLGKIADRNQTTVKALMRINGLKTSVLQIGQKVRVR